MLQNVVVVWIQCLLVDVDRHIRTSAPVVEQDVVVATLADRTTYSLFTLSVDCGSTFLRTLCHWRRNVCNMRFLVYLQKTIKVPSYNNFVDRDQSVINISQSTTTVADLVGTE